jgi:hypothetical protein
LKITILVEGDTERVFKPILNGFLQRHLSDRMPKLTFAEYNGRVEKGDALRKRVSAELSEPNAAQFVIALTDVYTGTKDFANAHDAKTQMSSWVPNETRFFPHVALHDFEAWLLPYWSDIQKLAGHNRTSPGANPEQVNHDKPPAYRLKEIFEIGNCRDSYVKPRDAARILKGKDLSVSINKCPELKAFVNTIIKLSGGTEIP